MSGEENTHFNTPIQNMVDDSRKDGTVGPLIGSIIIILIIVIGGLYYWGSLIVNKKVEIENQQIEEQQNQTTQVEQTAAQSNSDDVSSIEADLEATNIDTLDAEFQNME